MLFCTFKSSVPFYLAVFCVLWNLSNLLHLLFVQIGFSPPYVELLWGGGEGGGGLISADTYGRHPICCMHHSFHALPEVLCNYPDIDEGWFQQVIAGSSAVFTHLSEMSLSITSGKLICTQRLVDNLQMCVHVCAWFPRRSLIHCHDLPHTFLSIILFMLLIGIYL